MGPQELCFLWEFELELLELCCRFDNVLLAKECSTTAVPSEAKIVKNFLLIFSLLDALGILFPELCDWFVAGKAADRH